MFNGLLPSLPHIVNYSPENFSLDLFKGMMDKMRDEKPKEYVLLLDGYGMAVMQNDTEKIAYYERLFRIGKIAKFRRLILLYGSEMARVVSILEKRSRPGGDGRCFDF